MTPRVPSTSCRSVTRSRRRSSESRARSCFPSATTRTSYSLDGKRPRDLLVLSELRSVRAEQLTQRIVDSDALHAEADRQKSDNEDPKTRKTHAQKPSRSIPKAILLGVTVSSDNGFRSEPLADRALLLGQGRGKRL